MKPEVGFGGLIQWEVVGKCVCVVDDTVESTERLDCLGHDARRGIAISDTALQTNHTSADLFDCCACTLQCLQGSANDDDVGTLFGHGDGDALADACARAVYDCAAPSVATTRTCSV